MVSEEFGKDRFEERALLTKIAYYVDANIDLHPLSLKEYNEVAWEVLIHESKSNGIEIAA